MSVCKSLYRIFKSLQLFNKDPKLSNSPNVPTYIESRNIGRPFYNLVFKIENIYDFTDGGDSNGEGHGGAADGVGAVPERHHHREARRGGVGAARAPPAPHVTRPPRPPRPPARAALGATTWPLCPPGTQHNTRVLTVEHVKKTAEAC